MTGHGPGCWEEGELRAFLDGELPPQDLARLAAHLEGCTECRKRRQVLSARAARVSELVGGLTEPPAAPHRVPVLMPRPRPNYWMAAALALAAGWAAFVLLVPRRVEAPPPRVDFPGQLARVPAGGQPPAKASLPGQLAQGAAATAQPPARIAPVETPLGAAAAPPVARPRAVKRALPPPAPRANLAGFVPLDDDPIDAGVILRVALAEGRMQADVVYSPDGRPRAFRLVNAPAGK